MATHSESELKSTTFANLEASARRAASLLGVWASATPSTIVEAIDKKMEARFADPM